MENNGCIGCGLMTRVQKFLMQPWSSLEANTNWFLLIGIIFVGAFLWSRIIAQFKELVK